jgi:homoserine dehydrogenase
VEDHPLEYGDFEGIIPAGNYGAGAVIVWDRGEWLPLGDPLDGLAKGKLLFELRGYKLRGTWTLVKLKKSEKDWLLIKERDAGVIAKPRDFIFNGIENISLPDAIVAKEKKQGIKLVATAKKLENGKLAAFLLPQFVTVNDDLYHVQNEFNALTTESTFADAHFFKGKGAGAFPTASAVLSDISALGYNYKYEYKKIFHQTDTILSNDYYLKVFISTDDILKIDKSDFEWIEEWHNEFNYSWLIAVIHAEKLFATAWWKQEGVSLILCPEAIIETVDYKKISKRSLELAGVL